MSESQVKFHYEQNPENIPQLASGMMAAPLPDGRIILRFFNEYPTLPKSETWMIEEGKLKEQLHVETPDSQITRRIVSSVILDTNTLSGILAALNNMKNHGGNNNNPGTPPPGFRR